MTAIVGIAKGGQTWLGADSCGSSWSYRAPFTTPKLVELSTGSSKLLLGYTTSFRFGQILQYQVGSPHDIRKNAEEYLIRDFIPAVRKALSEHGWMKKESEREESGAALVGYRGRLFTFQSDLSLTEAQSGLDATGSGYDIYVTSVIPVVSGAVAVSGVVGIDLHLARTSAIGTGGTAAALSRGQRRIVRRIAARAI